MSFSPSFDRKLVGRIKIYAVEHKIVIVDRMAADLQEKYNRDYGRRKKNAFRKLVGMVYESMKKTEFKKEDDVHLKKRRKTDADKGSSSDSPNDEEETFAEYQDHNMLNSSVTSLYEKQIKLEPKPPTNCTSYEYSNVVAVPSPDPANHRKKWYIDTHPSKPSVLLTENDIQVTFEDKNNNIQSEISKIVLTNVEENKEMILKTPKSSETPKNKRLKTPKSHKKKEDVDLDIKGSEKVKTFTLQASNVKFEDVGGNEKTIRELCKLLVHMKHPEIYRTLGVIPPCGVLLHGPPGCGKSLLANAIAGELELPMIKLAATEIVSGVSGESEQKLREVFEMALASSPCIIFIDEIDAITPKREIASKDMERRIVAQLLSSLDNLNSSLCQILVIGATNRPDSLDPALRRAGRFDREICLGIPDEKAREGILRVLCKKMKLESNFNYSLLARLTPGYVGADLMSLCREAAMFSVDRIFTDLHHKNKMRVQEMDGEGMDIEGKDLSNNKTEIEEKKSSDDVTKYAELSTFELLIWLRETTPLTDEQLNAVLIEFSDFELALTVVQPSAKREGFATVPDVTWDDVGALEDVRDELTVAILAPVRNPAAFAALGLSKPPGILLAGPPGCGKTLLAKAIANESGINFISVKGPELLNMYVGESERAVRQCFERARASSPCVIFFDELDSLCPRRSGAETNSTARVVNQMLTEMDGLETRKQVYVMAATNRPDIIDPAVMRPGRLDKTLYIGLPSSEDRYKILQTITKNGTKPPISADVSLENIAEDERCSRFTGADLSSLVREAAVTALRDQISTKHVLSDEKVDLQISVKAEHFERAFTKVKPSVSLKDESRYLKMKGDLK